MPDPFPTAALPNIEAVDNCFRYAINELRAIGCDEELPTDRMAVARRLTDLAEHIEKGGDAPAVYGLMKMALTMPIQR